MCSLNGSLGNGSGLLGNDTSVDCLLEPPTPDIIHNRAVQAVFCMLYTVIFVLGIFGNVLVCYVVGRNKAMQTVTNFFITNLALSDILLCTLAVPFTPLYSFVGQWIFGPVLCHLVAYAQGTSVYISTLTLTSIAVDRFFVIIYPFQPRMKMSTCAAIVVFIWLFSLMATLPYGIFMSHNNRGGLDAEFFYCEEDWYTEDYRKVFGAFTALAQFVLPFFIITFCYVRVSLKLNDRAKCKPGAKNSRREELDRERKRRTNRMLIAMVTVFGVSWLPLNMVNLINDVNESTGDWPYYNLCFFIVHAIAMSSTCYNPFLYAWLNENFRKEFKQVLPCFERQTGLNGGHNGPNTASVALTSGHRKSLGGSQKNKGRSVAAATTTATTDAGGRDELANSVQEEVPLKATYAKGDDHVHLQLHHNDDLRPTANGHDASTVDLEQLRLPADAHLLDRDALQCDPQIGADFI
ncbi:prolactin-releasing peptide receptor [Neocloeon triangulifer]|uniref:prolactin-releasing peptide receptor n=1 Tax=Neocloeon triangulifer TaxID=2078957 RepID=UPI00286F04AE|nr:prolactin-releasing peptide receptor [Neocloeon triangulifer]